MNSVLFFNSHPIYFIIIKVTPYLYTLKPTLLSQLSHFVGSIVLYVHLEYIEPLTNKIIYNFMMFSYNNFPCPLDFTQWHFSNSHTTRI